MRAFASFTPARAGLVGAVLVVVRPEVLIICAAAGLAIGSGGHGAAGSWIYGILCHVGCIHGRDPDIGLRGCR